MYPVAFAPVSLSRISDEISKLFKGLEIEVESEESSKAQYRRSANRNVLLFSLSRSGDLEVQQLVENLSLVHPSRFFVVSFDDKLSGLTAEIAAYCHGISKTEHSCSEVIKLKCPTSAFPAVPAVIRANLLTGMATELYLLDPQINQSILNQVTSLTDMVVFDGGLFSHQPALLEQIAEMTNALVDIQWLATSGWREEVKMLFSRPSVREELPKLRRIVISCESSENAPVPFPAALLAGWFADRLRLAPIAGQENVLKSSSGATVELQYEVTRVKTRSALSGLTLDFGAGRAVTIARNEAGLASVVSLGAQFRSFRTLEDNSSAGLLSRFFMIGESTANYMAAFHFVLWKRLS